MNRETIGAGLILLLGLGSVVAPPQSIYWLPLQVSSPILSIINYHYFRQFLQATAPGSTTVNHYVFLSLTLISQACIGYPCFLMIASSLCPGLVESLIASNPVVACSILIVENGFFLLNH